MTKIQIWEFNKDINAWNVSITEVLPVCVTVLNCKWIDMTWGKHLGEGQAWVEDITLTQAFWKLKVTIWKLVPHMASSSNEFSWCSKFADGLSRVCSTKKVINYIHVCRTYREMTEIDTLFFSKLLSTYRVKICFMVWKNITAISHEQKLWVDRLRVQQCSQANNKENIKAPFYNPVVRGIHWWRVIFPHIIFQDCMTILWNTQDTLFLIVYVWFETVLKIKASPTARDWQPFRRTDNFFRFSFLSFHV